MDNSSNSVLTKRVVARLKIICRLTVPAAIFSYCITKTSIDVLPSKNQALCEYCTYVSKLKHC